jgi:hypothetical protein
MHMHGKHSRVGVRASCTHEHAHAWKAEQSRCPWLPPLSCMHAHERKQGRVGGCGFLQSVIGRPSRGHDAARVPFGGCGNCFIAVPSEVALGTSASACWRPRHAGTLLTLPGLCLHGAQCLCNCYAMLQQPSLAVIPLCGMPPPPKFPGP